MVLQKTVPPFCQACLSYRSKKKKKIWDVSLHSCKNDISFAYTGTRACGLEPLWAWMVHETFISLVWCWGTIFYDYCIYQSKLLPQQLWKAVMICHHEAWCKHVTCDCWHVWHLWGQKAFSNRGNACFYDRVYNHPCHCCKTWWC